VRVDYRRSRGVDKLPRWHRSRPLMRTVKVASGVAALLLAIGVPAAVFLGIRRRAGGAQPDMVNAACNSASFSCNVLLGIVTPLLLLAAAYVVFLLFRLSRVHRPYVRKARERPLDLVQTAGTIIDEVVGRDELCRVMMQDLFDPATRRPHVVVGGVGSGKTALIVRLTELLAKRGAVPVPVRLRDAQDTLDFRELGRRRFLADAEGALLTDADRERVWWELCKNDRIVVLADGLEEALIEGEAEKDRDNHIRLAIRRAEEHSLPLVVASRPHDPLRGMDATIVELEPLSEEAALQYVRGTEPGPDEQRLDWIVETADVVETPLYLHITRELHRGRLMEWVSPSGTDGQLDTRSVDRPELRLRLLDAWTRALEEGYFKQGLALGRRERQATILQLAALACVGLQQDSLYVRFGELEEALTQDVSGARMGTRHGSRPPRAGLGSVARSVGRRPTPYRRITGAVERQLPTLGGSWDLRLAAARGTQLGLVEAFGDGVRFPHSIMQAYLGARLIDVAMADPAYRQSALENPGRELLLALVMSSRAKKRSVGPNSTARMPVRAARSFLRRRPMQAVLSDAAGRHDNVKALDLCAAALEIDSIDPMPEQASIASRLQAQWPRISSRDLRTLEEAKLNLVHRFGDAATSIAAVGRGAAAYGQFYAIACAEPSYPVRLAAAQEIGAGGDEAFSALKTELGPPNPQLTLPARNRWRLTRPSVGFRQSQHDDEENQRWREELMRAWLAPLLVASVNKQTSDARRQLERWTQFVGTEDLGPDENLRLSLEIALAQGFKHAANRRRSYAAIHAAAGDYLFEQARAMLRRARFWFSRLTLVHALCLWSLSDDTGRQRSPRRRADLQVRVRHWLMTPDGQQEHPLVAEACRLVVAALETGEPERFMWIDESGVLGRVGSLPTSRTSRRKHNLWIPPSTGWTALDPRAQQLVADVLLLLNLAERGDRPSDRERRLRRANPNSLPPCLAGDRERLAPNRTAATAVASRPGSNCASGCQFELCPYPAKGERYYRVELSEAFCRRQRILVRRPRVGPGPWQRGRPRALERFWGLMEERARPDRPQ
jgi:hypothetical protein